MTTPKYTREQLANYYKMQEKYNSVIKRDAIGDKDVVYGSRALNAQVPKYLEKKTDDWDIFTNKPKREAKELERKLDVAYGGNYFYTKPAQHKGTFKVESFVTGKEVADYTQKPKRIPFVQKQNVRYVPLSWIEQSAKRILRDSESKYRWEKDRDTLQRIKVARGNKQ